MERSASSIVDCRCVVANFPLCPIVLVHTVHHNNRRIPINRWQRTDLLPFPPTGRLYAVLNNRRRPHRRECCPVPVASPFHLISKGTLPDPSAYVRSPLLASSTYTSIPKPHPASTHSPPWPRSTPPYQVHPHTSQSSSPFAQYQSVTRLGTRHGPSNTHPLT